MMLTTTSQSRVLVVGAGGIGCELLKNLVLSGFGDIHIVDLDTIDLSNLNRQFLFRQEHIKKSKALVAKEAAQKFNPNSKLTAHHSNIKDSQFNVKYFSSFDLVFNALDNLEARRHVNKMCLAADVPLIESGTTGFNGQVQVIKKSKTACYDCTPKQTPKSFPVCTIRSTPSQPIHCIVWAKSYLLPELFGVSEDETPDMDTTRDADNAEEIEKLKQEAQALKKIRESMGSEEFSKQVFDKVFKEDIERLANMEDMWKERKRPEPLSFETLSEEASNIDTTTSLTDQQTWSRGENFIVFKDSLQRLSKRLADEQAAALKLGLAKPVITFDKDDEDTLDFVASAGNLRSIIFGIEPKSKFDTKQMAGNIIPAIATTNAMIAGLCVLQAFKVLKGDYGRTKMIFLDRGNVSAGPSDFPNPGCVVCSMAMLTVQVDLERATLKDLVEEILRQKLGYGDEISILSESGLLYDPDMEENLEKKLAEFDIRDASFIVIKDDTEEAPRVDLQLVIEAQQAEGAEKSISLSLREGQTLEIPSKPKKERVNGTENGDMNGESVNTNGTSQPSATAKRKREIDEVEAQEGTPAKKTQQIAINGDSQDAVVVEEEGAIVLD